MPNDKIIDFSNYTIDKFDDYIKEMYECTCKFTTPNGETVYCMNCPKDVSEFSSGRNICNCHTLTECYLKRFLGGSFYSDVIQHDIQSKHVNRLTEEIDKQILNEMFKDKELQKLINK